jgi:hypothetical protein
MVAFTYLSRSFIDQLFNKIPELKTIFSYLFTKEDLVHTDNYLVKDL